MCRMRRRRLYGRPARLFFDRLLLGLLRLDDFDIPDFAEQDRLSRIFGQELLELLPDPVPSGIVMLAPTVEIAVLAAFPQLGTAKPPEAEDVAVGPPIGPTSRRRLLDHILVLLHPLLQFPGPAFFRIKARHVEHGYPRSSGKGRSRLSVSEPPQKKSECATRMSSLSRPNDKSDRVDPNP